MNLLPENTPVFRRSGVDLILGVTYRVELEDCCVVGEFHATLTALTAHDGMLEVTEWGNGVRLTEHLGVTIWPDNRGE